MARSRKRNEVVEFSSWFARLIGVEVNFNSPQFKKILGQAAKLKRDGYNLNSAKKVISAMRTRGIRIETPYCITWQSPDRSHSWYDFSRPQLPPVWNGLGVRLMQAGDIPARVE